MIGVQAAVGTVINTENVDLLYVTSISFLFVLTIAILSSIVQYRNSKYLRDLTNNWIYACSFPKPEIEERKASPK